MIKSAIILAAGKGKRMLPLKKKIPKALVKIKNKTLIERKINSLRKIQINNIHVTVGHKSFLLSKYLYNKKVNSIINTRGQNNTWWIFNSLLGSINENVLLSTCDSILDLDKKFLNNEIEKNKKNICTLLLVKADKNFRGDYIYIKNKKIKEISRNKKTKFFASGIQIVNPFKIKKLLINQKIKNFNELWNYLIIKKKIGYTKIYKKKWSSFDTLEQVKKYQKKYEK